MIAALSAWHGRHEAAAEALAAVSALPAHVVVEAFSVLTRLPSGLAVAPALAASVIASEFREPALRLDDGERARVLERLAGAGVAGGATYDGLVALEAHAHGRMLLTLDQRAQSTYQRLGVGFEPIG